MARSRPQAEAPKAAPPRKRKPVELDEDIVRMIDLIVTVVGGTTPKWASNALRPLVRAQMRAVVKDINEEYAELLGDEPGPK